MAITEKFQIRAALHDESKESWVWVQHNDIKTNRGKFIKISYPQEKTSIVCECRVIDPNFIKKYNVNGRISIGSIPTIVIHEYYRELLKINNLKGGECNFKIEKKDYFTGSICCNWHHPNSTTRVNFQIGFIGLSIAVVPPLFYVLKKIILFFWNLSCC